jgi:hypothetical protein
VELERAELARLLDRAMALLAPDTRRVLVERYLEESPVAEVAARLGLSEGAVAMKLHRGRLTLRRVLTSTLREEAAGLGLVPAAGAAADGGRGWRETPIWCPACGARRLQARLSDDGIAFRCAGGGGILGRSSDGAVFRGLTSFRPVLHRLLAHATRWARESLAADAAPCHGCGRQLPLQRGSATAPPAACRAEHGAASGATPVIYVRCPTCGAACSQELAGMVFGLPDVRRFWRDHRRIRLLPARRIEADGQPIAVVGFESVTETARLDVLTDPERFRLLGVRGG